MDSEGKMKNINEKIEDMCIRYIDMPLDVIEAYFQMYKDAFVSELEYELFNQFKNRCNMSAVEAEKTVKEISEEVKNFKQETVLKKEYNIEEILSLVENCIIDCKKWINESDNQQVKERNNIIKKFLDSYLEEKSDDDCDISRKYVERLEKDISKVYKLVKSDKAIKKIFKPVNSKFNFRCKGDIEIYLKRLIEIKTQLKLLPEKFAVIESYKQDMLYILEVYENKFNDIASNINSSSKIESEHQFHLETKDKEENYYSSLPSYIFMTPQETDEENSENGKCKSD